MVDGENVLMPGGKFNAFSVGLLKIGRGVKMQLNFLVLFVVCAVTSTISRLHSCLPESADEFIAGVRNSLFWQHADLFEHFCFGVGATFLACAILVYLLSKISEIEYAPLWVKFYRSTMQRYSASTQDNCILAVAMLCTLSESYSWEHEQSLLTGVMQYDQIFADIAGAVVAVMAAKVMMKRAAISSWRSTV